MPKLAANLSFLFQDRPFLSRFEAARRCGFRGVEFMFPYDHSAADVAAAARDAGVSIVLFNAPPGDWSAGDRGLAASPDRRDEFQRSMALAFDYASVLKPDALHVMAGLAEPSDPLAKAAYVENLRWAVAQAPQGLRLTIEPINQRDMPGYFLRNSDQALEILDAVGADNLFLQYDLYHAQIVEGDLTRRLERLAPRLGHVQIAGVPDRSEPDRGETNHRWLLDRLDALGYAGWVGCEYRPAGDASAGLGWAADYGVVPD